MTTKKVLFIIAILLIFAIPLATLFVGQRLPKLPEVFVQYIHVDEPDYDQSFNTFSQYMSTEGQIGIVFSQDTSIWSCYYDESAPFSGKKTNCVWNGSLEDWFNSVDWGGVPQEYLPDVSQPFNTVSQWRRIGDDAGHVGTVITQGTNMWAFDWSPEAEYSGLQTTCTWYGTFTDWLNEIDFTTNCQGKEPSATTPIQAISQYENNTASKDTKTIILQGNKIWAFTQEPSGNTVCNAAEVSLDDWWTNTVSNHGTCSQPSSWDTIAQWKKADDSLETTITYQNKMWKFEESDSETSCLEEKSLSDWGNEVAWGQLDTDEDGVADVVDDCPNEPGPASNNGCPLSSSPAPSTSPTTSPSPAPEEALIFTASPSGLLDEGQSLIAATLYAEGTDWVKQTILNYEGKGWVDISELDQSETYNFFLKAHPFLIVKEEVDLANLPEIVDFGELKTGDLNADNEINGLDWSWMKMYFGENTNE